MSAKAKAKGTAKKPVKKVIKKAVNKTVAKKTIKQVAKKSKPSSTRKIVKALSKKTAAKKTAEKPKKNVTKKPVKKLVEKKTTVKPVKKTAVKKTVKKNVSPKPKLTPAKKHAEVSKPKITVEKKAVTKKTKTEKTTTYEPKRSEKYMNKKMQEHFRELLLKWKAELMSEIENTMRSIKSEAVIVADPNDRATQEEEFSLELRTRDRERKLIDKIDEALEAINNDEYGYCELCGEEIGIKRLEARPTATLCIDCKTLEEIREKQRGA